MEKRAYSEKEANELGFDGGGYHFPSNPGEYNGTLVMKIWGNLKLYCYFKTDLGEKLRLCVFYNYNDLTAYRPRNSNIDFSYISIGTKWKISVVENSKRKLTWDKAIALE